MGLGSNGTGQGHAAWGMEVNSPPFWKSTLWTCHVPWLFSVMSLAYLKLTYILITLASGNSIW